MSKKSNLTKKALISSVIALVLCATMLLGTTFAWFTDTATAGVNTIQSGTLDVAIVDDDGQSLEGQTLNFVKAAEAPADEAILWEPGATYKLQDFHIKNNGNLGLQFMLIINGIDGDAKLLEAIDWTLKLGDSEQNIEEFAGVLIPGAMTSCITISGTMRTDAGNEYQGLTAEGIGITVVATQLTHEYDSFGNQYDANASFPTVEFTEGTHVLNDTLVATGDKTDAVVVSGEGTEVDITGGYYQGSWALYANDKANVDVLGGTFSSTGSCAVLANNGATVNIYGGFFEAAAEHAGESFVLNLQDNTGSDINVYGGTFVNFNPAEAMTEPTSEGRPYNFLADGYTVVAEQHGEETWYIVRPEAEADTVEDLQQALTNGTPVTLTDDIELNNELLIVPANTDVTIDLNGNDITGVATNASASNLIKVNSGSSLTLTGNGTVSSRATNPDTNWGDGKPNQYPGYASNTISNSGTLIINGATIINYTGRGGASYCIDNYPGANLIINSGTIEQAGGDVAIRMFANSATTETNVTINGGTITGYRAVWIHLPSNNANVAPKVNLTVTGGTLTSSDTNNWNQAIYSYSYGNSFAATIVNITGGVFNGDLAFSGGTKIDRETVNITGGTFNGDVFYYTADDVEYIPY